MYKMRNFLYRFIQVLAKNWGQFLLVYISSQVLLPSEFSQIIYLMSYIFLLSVLSDLGISWSVNRFSAVSEKPEIIKNNAFFVVLIMSLIIGISYALYILSSPWYASYLPLVLIIFWVPLNGVYDWYLRARDRFNSLAVGTCIASIVWLISGYYLMSLHGVQWAIYAYSLYFWLHWIILMTLDYPSKAWVNIVQMKTILSYSLYIGIANIGYYLFTKVDIIFLWKLWYLSEVWIYEIVNQIFYLMILPTLILWSIISWKVAKNVEQFGLQGIKATWIKESLILLLCGTVLTAVSFFIIRDLFEIFFPLYDQEVLWSFFSLLLILVPFRYVTSFMNVGYITPAWLARILSVTTVVWWICNCLLNFIAIQTFWPIGVIYATLLSQTWFMISNTLWFISKIRHGK